MSCSEWKKCTLGGLVKFQRGHDLSKTKMTGEGYIVAGSNGIIGYHNEYTTEGPCITIGRSGNVGIPYYYDEKCWAHNTTLYIKEFYDVDPKYIYYYLKTLNLGHYAGGSAVPTLNRNHIHPIEVYVPSDIEEQKRISSILSSLDSKIELNNEMNKTLEEMAQALFKRWFVDFEFPNKDGEPYKSSGGEMVESELGMIPKGWRVSSLDNIANYLNGLAMQKYRPESDEFIPVIKIKDLGNGRTDNSSDKASINIPKQYIINDGDVIFSWSGTLMVKIWTGGIGGLNQHLFKVTSEEYDKWYYYLWTNYHLEKFKAIAKDKATTMGHIKRSNLTEARVVIPDVDVYRRLNNIMKPIIDKIIQVNVQSKQLIELRDSLLPKLMSGEIRVEDVEANL